MTPKTLKDILLLFMFMLLPVSAPALDVLSDEELADISGQSGVSIMPNISLNVHIDVLAWGDSDGLGPNNVWGQHTTGGYFGISDLIINNLTITPRAGVHTGMWPLTIDVGSAPVGSSDESYTSLRLDENSYKAMLAAFDHR